MNDEREREDFEKGMAASQWREVVGSMAYEMIQANRRLGEAIDRFADSQVRQAETAHKLSRYVLWLTCVMAGAAVLQGAHAYLTL